jgi:hypothetical protein
MARLELPFDLDELICAKQVSVVESVEAGKLKAFLQWIVTQLQRPSGDGQESIEALKKQNADLNGALSDLAKKQVGPPCRIDAAR